MRNKERKNLVSEADRAYLPFLPYRGDMIIEDRGSDTKWRVSVSSSSVFPYDFLTMILEDDMLPNDETGKRKKKGRKRGQKFLLKSKIQIDTNRIIFIPLRKILISFLTTHQYRKRSL